MTVRTTELDRQREDKVCALLESAWGVRIHRTGFFDSYDLLGIEGGKTRFIGEIKSRHVSHDTYPSVFLSAHKWLTLLSGSKGLGVKGLFIVSFIDEVRWIDVAQVDASKCEIAGRVDRPDAPNDQELVIHVPVNAMGVVRQVEECVA